MVDCCRGWHPFVVASSLGGVSFSPERSLAFSQRFPTSFIGLGQLLV